MYSIINMNSWITHYRVNFPKLKYPLQNMGRVKIDFCGIQKTMLQMLNIWNPDYFFIQYYSFYQTPPILMCTQKKSIHSQTH